MSENASVVQEGNQNGQVAEGNQTASNAQPQPQAQQQPAGFAVIKSILFRVFIIYMVSSFFRRPSPAPQASTENGGVVQSMSASNLFMRGTSFDIYVYISEDEHFELNEALARKETPFWTEEEIVYGDWYGGFFKDGSYIKNGQVKLSQRVMNNGSLYIHVYIVESNKSLNPDDENYAGSMAIISKSKQLNKFKKRHFHTSKNLITGETEAHPDLIRLPNQTNYEILSHWHPNLTINLIDDQTPWTKGSIPSPLDEYIEFIPGTNFYYPILYFNDYWNLNTGYQPINETTPIVNLTLTFAPLSLFKWQMYAAQGMRSKWYSFMGEGFGEENDDEQDSLKIAFLETNPYLLGLTIIVSLVHSVFEFLAFKNDIQFWRNRKSLEGLSVRSVFFGVFQSLIVLLYILDNEANFIIKVSVFIGLAIEIWKIHKVIDVKLDRENRLFGLPRIQFQDKSTYTESDTKKYDMLAFRYLSWGLFPLLGIYCVYSLFYLEHRGWYSWVLGMLYGFLLTFGFIMMTPQLFINYKLKSVAHLPWRMLTYKALNTFIDDLFAFVIRMPMLYRLGCFRDDIIFLIFLYQRYIYRVDPKRVNEFGISGEMLTDPASGENVSNTQIEEKPENLSVEESGEEIEGDKKND